MGWVIALLAALVVIVALAALQVSHQLGQIIERLADLQIGILKLRRGE